MRVTAGGRPAWMRIPLSVDEQLDEINQLAQASERLPHSRLMLAALRLGLEGLPMVDSGYWATIASAGASGFEVDVKRRKP
jgi:hypothetical protein